MRQLSSNYRAIFFFFFKLNQFWSLELSDNNYPMFSSLIRIAFFLFITFIYTIVFFFGFVLICFIKKRLKNRYLIVFLKQGFD